jgi:hypothetical protein
MKATVKITIPDNYLEIVARRVGIEQWLRACIKSALNVSNSDIDVKVKKENEEPKKKRESLHEMISQKEAEALKAKVEEKEDNHAR